jgi:hypothetical protein
MSRSGIGRHGNNLCDPSVEIEVIGAILPAMEGICAGDRKKVYRGLTRMNADCKTNLNHKGHEGTQRKNQAKAFTTGVAEEHGGDKTISSSALSAFICVNLRRKVWPLSSQAQPLGLDSKHHHF